ncbi:transposase [Psychromonas sp. MB-3u-54]
MPLTTKRDKIFNGGKSSIGWFFAVKLQLIVNHLGDLFNKR